MVTATTERRGTSAYRELSLSSVTPDQIVEMTLHVIAGYNGPIHLSVQANDQAQADALLDRLAALPEVQALLPKETTS